MSKQTDCPLCNSKATSHPNYEKDTIFYTCPVCGRYEISVFHKINHNYLASYLIYNRFEDCINEYRYHTTLDKELCDKYREDFEKGNNTHGRPVHMDEEIIENWYPKTFSERIDYILLYLNNRIKHIGQQQSFEYSELLSAFFIDRKEQNKSSANNANEWCHRDDDDCENELKYMLDYLKECSYIKFLDGYSEKVWAEISLSPNGYARIDVLQKNTAFGKNVLVAMKFGDETKNLRESIRKGITEAGYNAVFIDEVQHNDFITPELLKYIKDSKFVVVDLTHQNNGAYFEEGYAMGLGKPVIQLCKKDTHLHFDIAQKNTIIWETEEDIPDKLVNRIKATIE